jgi:hypothetical protein
MSLLTELDAFYLDRRRCAELDAGVDGPAVWMACSCGPTMAQRDSAAQRPLRNVHRHDHGDGAGTDGRPTVNVLPFPGPPLDACTVPP